MIKLENDELDLKMLKDLKNDNWIEKWKETLTEKEIERLVKNRLLPNLYLKEFPETQYTIEELKKTDDLDSYSVKIKFTNIQSKNDEEEIYFFLDTVDTKLVNIPGYGVLLHSQGYYFHSHYPLRYTFKLTIV